MILFRIDQKQRIIDILLRIMVQNIGFTPSQIGSLFLFLARQIAKPKNSILVNKMLFNQVTDNLLTNDLIISAYNRLLNS